MTDRPEIPKTRTRRLLGANVAYTKKIGVVDQVRQDGSQSKSRNDRQFARKFALEPDMNREVEFLFDYGSPFSYLANVQIEGFAKRNGAEVTYTPILLGANVLG